MPSRVQKQPRGALFLFFRTERQKSSTVIQIIEGTRMYPKEPLVSYLDETEPIECLYGRVQRVVTGGDGGIANVHIVEVSKGTTHYHEGYDEIYYVLTGSGELRVGDQEFRLCPGAVAVIPRGIPHSLSADCLEGREGKLKFIIFGTPPMAIDDERAAPKKR